MYMNTFALHYSIIPLTRPLTIGRCMEDSVSISSVLLFVADVGELFDDAPLLPALAPPPPPVFVRCRDEVSVFGGRATSTHTLGRFCTRSGVPFDATDER